MTSTTRLLTSIAVLAAVALGLAGAAAAEEVAARIGDTTISLAEVDQRAMGANMQTYQQLYDARRAALDALIAERLAKAEAEKAGQPVDAYISAQVEARLTPPTDAEIEAFYEQNKGRVGGRTLEQLRPQIEVFLKNQRRQAAQKEYIDGLMAANKVTVALDPPRVPVEVPAGEPAKGPADAPVEIVMFSEFQCPFCARVEPTITQVMDTYGDKVRLVFRDFPLAMHQDAQKAAEAAQCANDQGKFWEYHDLLFQNQRALGVDKLKEYAANLGLDAEAFGTCLDSGTHTQAVREDEAAGRAYGVSGTPAFFINGRFLNGAQPYENFAKVIDEELQRKGVATN